MAGAATTRTTRGAGGGKGGGGAGTGAGGAGSGASGAAGDAKLLKLGLESSTDRRRVMAVVMKEEETPSFINWFEVLIVASVSVFVRKGVGDRRVQGDGQRIMSLLSSLSLLLLFSDTLKLHAFLLVFLETSAGFQV